MSRHATGKEEKPENSATRSQPSKCSSTITNLFVNENNNNSPSKSKGNKERRSALAHELKDWRAQFHSQYGMQPTEEDLINSVSMGGKYLEYQQLMAEKKLHHREKKEQQRPAELSLSACSVNMTNTNNNVASMTFNVGNNNNHNVAPLLKNTSPNSGSPTAIPTPVGIVRQLRTTPAAETSDHHLQKNSNDPKQQHQQQQQRTLESTLAIVTAERDAAAVRAAQLEGQCNALKANLESLTDERDAAVARASQLQQQMEEQRKAFESKISQLKGLLCMHQATKQKPSSPVTLGDEKRKDKSLEGSAAASLNASVFSITMEQSFEAAPTGPISPFHRTGDTSVAFSGGTVEWIEKVKHVLEKENNPYKSSVGMDKLPFQLIKHVVCTNNITVLDLSRWNTDTITHISDFFLKDTPTLTQLDLPKFNRVHVIGKEFLASSSKHGSSLKALDMSHCFPNAETIEDDFLSNANSLESLTLPRFSHVSEIGARFLFNSNLKQLDLSHCFKTVDAIGQCFLSNAPQLESLTLPPFEELHEIGENFLSNNGVKELDLSVCFPKVEKVGSGFLIKTTQLASLKLPAFNTLKKVPDSFLRNSGIADLDISHCFTNVENIGEFFLKDTMQLRSVNFPSFGKVKEITKSFLRNSSLQTLDLSHTFEQVETIGEFFLLETKQLQTLNLPTFENVKAIGPRFLFQSRVNDLDLTNCFPSVETIGEHFLKDAFAGTQQSQPLKLPSFASVKKVGRWFLSNANIAELDMSHSFPSLEIISDFFLSDTKQLKSLKLPSFSNVKVVGRWFLTNSNLKQLDLSHCFKTVDAIGQCFLSNAPQLESLKLPPFDKVKVIRDDFLTNSCITELDISSSFPILETIGGFFLSETKHLVTLKLPRFDKVKEIEKNFLCQSSIKTLDLSHCFPNATTLSYSFLEETQQLQSLKLPVFANVKTIGKRFLYCSNAIKTVVFPENAFRKVLNKPENFACGLHDTSLPRHWNNTASWIPIDVHDNRNTQLEKLGDPEYDKKTNELKLRHVRATNNNASSLEPVRIGDGFLCIEQWTGLIDFSGLGRVMSIGQDFLQGTALRSLDLSTLSFADQRVASSIIGVVIEDRFLSGCEHLERVKFPSSFSSVTSIGNDFLSHCPELKSINLEFFTNVAHIGDNFLFGCSNLVEVIVPRNTLNHVTQIGVNFLVGTSLSTLDLSSLENLSSIGCRFLQDCVELTNVEVGGNRLLEQQCKGIGYITIDLSDDLCTIEEAIQEWCNSNQTKHFHIKVVNNVQRCKVMEDSFLCAADPSPSSVTSSPSSPLLYVSSSTKKKGEGSRTTEDNSSGGCDLSSNTAALSSSTVLLCSTGTFDTIKSTKKAKNRKKIVASLLKDGLISVDLSDLKNIEHIGSNFLRGCQKLRSVKLPVEDSALLVSIGDSFCAKCSQLRSLDLSKSHNLRRIGSNFLRGCNLLQEVVFSHSASISEIGPGYMSQCYSIRNLNLAPFSSLAVLSNGFLAYTKLARIDLRPLGSITTIGNNCFEHQEGLKEIDLSPLVNLKTIGDGFANNSAAVQTVILSSSYPMSLEHIGDSFLEQCKNLNQLVARKPLTKLTSVGDWFLCRCSNALTTIDLAPFSEVTSIGKGFASGCSSLRWVENIAALFQQQQQQEEEEVIAAATTAKKAFPCFTVGEGMFYKCHPKLSSVNQQPAPPEIVRVLLTKVSYEILNDDENEHVEK